MCRGVVEETHRSFSYLALVLLAEDRRAGLVDWRAGIEACVRVGEWWVVISHSTSTHNVTTRGGDFPILFLSLSPSPVLCVALMCPHT